jgi:hypothetical protein
MNLPNPSESDPQHDRRASDQSKQGRHEQSGADESQKPGKIPSLLDSLSETESLKGKRIRIINDED